MKKRQIPKFSNFRVNLKGSFVKNSFMKCFLVIIALFPQASCEKRNKLNGEKIK